MDFNIGNLSSCVMGAVVQLATAAVSLVEETAEAVLGAIAGLTNVPEDGELDEDELEGFLNNLSKVVVGAIIATLGSQSAGIKNYDEEDSEDDEDSEEVAVDGNDLDNYLYDYIWVFGKKIQIGKKRYSANQLSDLPREMKWEADGYVYYYSLQEQPFSEGVFGGEPMYGQEITLNDGRVINTKVYGYVLTYTDAPPPPEIKDGTVPFVPGGGMLEKGILGDGETSEATSAKSIAEGKNGVSDAFKYNTYKWGNRKKLRDHVERHGADFGTNDPDEYATMANNFYKNRLKHQVKVDEDGVIRVYDSDTNTFGSYNSDGTTRTYFKPEDGQAFFDSQPGQ